MVEAAFEAIDNFGFPIHLVSAADFLQMPSIVVFEEVRESSRHKVIDLLQDARSFFDVLSSSQRMIFVSHQWTNLGAPDDQCIQLPVMVAAVRKVAEENGWDLSDVWIWVDYSCIPQKHKPSQASAIRSLALYSSLANAIIMAAPSLTQGFTGLPIGKETYQQRAWCRAEQFCYGLIHGSINMWLATSCDEIVLAGADWLNVSKMVFEGEMTCCMMKHTSGGVETVCDRLSLREPVLGLYGAWYRKKLEKAKLAKNGPAAAVVVAYPIGENLESELTDLFQGEDMERMFPRTFQMTSVRGTKTKELFGDVITRMEKMQDDAFAGIVPKHRIKRDWGAISILHAASTNTRLTAKRQSSVSVLPARGRAESGRAYAL